MDVPGVTVPRSLSLEGPRRQISESFRNFSRHPVQPEGDILRFRRSERLLHWAIAAPYVICWLSALILVVAYNPDPHRPWRDVFSILHRSAAIGLIVLPPLVMLKNRKDYRIHIYNITCGWLWTLNDFKWLALMGLAAISKKIKLPEQGKFNAAEKVNFMSVMVACPVFILTGVIIWTQSAAWAAWLVHGLLALLVTPTMLGHIYMATLNPDTRAGLSGMFSGYVDRQWARHHYGLWYKEHVEMAVRTGGENEEMIHPPEHKIHLYCSPCGKKSIVSWGSLLQRVFSSATLSCPHCGETVSAIAAITDQKELEWIRRKLDVSSMTPASAD